MIVARVEATDEPPPLRAFDDARFEDTQPLDPLDVNNPLDANALDETAKDTQKLEAVTPEEVNEELRITDKLPIATGDDTLPMSPPTPRLSATRPAEKKPEGAKARRSRLGWAVFFVFVLALGAVGAWYYWSHLQTVSSRSR